ncbi:MAG: hypothetical protein R6T96_15110, partial [Longimicrobiales bacterium]
VLAIELLCGAQALEYLKPLRPGKGVEEAYAVIREGIPPLRGDRVLSGDMEEVARLVRAGTFSGIDAS